MIPVGIERDRKIATLRHKTICMPVKEGINGCCMPYGTPCRDCSWLNKPYSTDIAVAMELAEEMKASDDSEMFFLLRDAWFNWLHPDRECLELPDAISSAWLKWKDTSQ